MSTPPRSATGVPLTQNTAPVVKHRCLYTHDLRRKAKRWQDGFLRYHTFNKRIMVYDTAGNFVGDQHGRHEEGIQDGDELELDRGVLVQVCESMERTETDLSGLYSNKKTQQSPRPRPGDSPVPSMRPGTGTPVRSSLSSQQPRSLNDLLGIRKTPVARLMSPYEQRHPPKETVRDQSPPDRPTPDRPAKRLKATPSKGPRDQARPAPVVIDLCEPSEKSPEPVQTSKASASTRVSDSSPRAIPRPPTTNTSTEPKRKNSTTTPRVAPPPSPPSAPPNAESRPPEAPLNTLRISTDRPRKKLLYQALLPRQPAPTTPSTISKTAPDSQAAHSKIPPSTNPEFAPSSSTLSILDEMVNNSASRPAARMNPTTRSTALRKALSDPTALTRRNGPTALTMRNNPFGGPLQEDTPGEQGPWTAEAMDLFDFWPPGREKPV
ncbi:hypothetical protein P168DRAFT_302574 [Aspergillus campestris IBT 28561]|uniref:5'-3' DNA helicase ZGRF1-like N-terminal domain-containing protein n=1 Tax=Aspergillus campestris (strain IBT 28561) TaxID=1392248 RepID=A0A2I1D8I0_ASPC2|nr:uncharacterized protein P168DRAFT_302574 [Aspergillus campestris IBT 28561]PKY06191.1 hypothetical protein P168DRAFT_302574 [Aspergillus campestris IBT 28561]